jgi:hypothetical protein
MRRSAGKPSTTRLRGLARAARREPGALRLLPLLALYAVIAAIAQPGPSPVGDEAPLLRFADRILHGHYAVPGTMDSISYLWHGPGTPLLLTPLVALDIPLVALRFVGPLLLFAAALVFYRLLRMRFTPRGALMGTYAFGLYVPFYEGLPSLHKEPLAILLVTAGLLWTGRVLAGGRRRYVLLAGLALGGLAMVRLEYGWLALALLAASAVWWVVAADRAPGRRMTCVCVVALATCVPWLLYTYELTGQPLYWGNSGGSSLYWMSPTGGGETGQWHAVHTVFQDPALSRYRALFIGLQRLTPLQRDEALGRVALANIRASPGLYVRNLAANVGRLWFFQPFRPPPPTGVVVTYVVANALLLAAVGWAAVVLIPRRRRLPRETLPFAAFATGALLVHVVTSAEPRMALPAVPALLWLVVHAGSRPALSPLRQVSG